MQQEHLFFHGVAQRQHRRASGPAPSTRPEGGERIDDFVAWLFDLDGLPVDQYRADALARRLPACLRMLGAGTIAEARRAIRERPKLALPAISVMLLGVTTFCRDEKVFDGLQRTVLPDLLGRFGRLRIWSAACSDGRELYSLAILLAEAGRLRECQLLGSDCRWDAVCQAREGVYPADMLEALAPRRRDAFFIPEEGGMRAVDSLRDSIKWKRANLFSHAEPGPWHLIMWRNMAIYLNSPAAEETWIKLVAELARGGILVTGKADSPPRTLPLVRLGNCTYMRSER